ncbi:YafY family protein [Amycolatopsis sp. WQ 127309]|uniref:helix-turn-helix transcriptional regulator n=1 Tax=Amycolatopsis sp. WQ 127309 TaxID=2932773 RepID=UPI001FF22EA1|nr:YafY family protein [Amycolatopsis sp. WQ 127309]UOZ06332.1 YafY family transcriptional regulator [Amycolatopsis sp. WQ 127309]
MTRPTARVLALLEILQGGGTRTVADLAGRLGVDERTVRRYAAHLIDLDVPVRTVRGRYGGYRLAPGFRMPPLMLTDEEALAVLLGLVAGQRAGLVTASGVATESAAAKVRRVLPEALGRKLDALLDTLGFTSPARPAASPETAVLLTLAEAARDRRPVAVSYTAWDGRASERTVHPYGIVAHSGRWYVTGEDSASGEVRTFRLDRIAAATPGAGSFAVPDGFDPGAHVLSRLAEVPHRHEVSVRVRATAEQVRPRLPAGIATVTAIAGEPGWVRVRLRAERLDWVPSVLASLDRPFVIETPDALRDRVRTFARGLTAGADADPGEIVEEPERR